VHNLPRGHCRQMVNVSQLAKLFIPTQRPL
jgi:hypothetical protein